MPIFFNSILFVAMAPGAMFVSSDAHQSYVDVMNRASLGQLILTGVLGYELDPETAALFRRVQPRGFILFGLNIQSAAHLRKLSDDLRDDSDVDTTITFVQ